MAFPVIYCPYLPAAAMAIFPFILVKEKRYRYHKVLLHHEKIHLMQQMEMLLVFFYLLYFLNYLLNLMRYRDHQKAYLNIVFEREAYLMEDDLSYLKKRKFWAWTVY